MDQKRFPLLHKILATSYFKNYLPESADLIGITPPEAIANFVQEGIYHLKEQIEGIEFFIDKYDHIGSEYSKEVEKHKEDLNQAQQTLQQWEEYLKKIKTK